MIRRQFTRGPWAVVIEPGLLMLPKKNVPTIQNADSTVLVALVSDAEGEVANALLLAAAPEMLDALVGVLNPTGHTDVCTERRAFGETKCSKCCARIRAAIKKATGEAP